MVNDQLICTEKDISQPLRQFELQKRIRLNWIAALLLARCGTSAVVRTRRREPEILARLAVRLATIAVRDFDHAGTSGQLLDQLFGGGAVLLVEVGVPLVEQVDRGIRVGCDLLERLQLPLAGREPALATASALGGRRLFCG